MRPLLSAQNSILLLKARSFFINLISQTTITTHTLTPTPTHIHPKHLFSHFSINAPSPHTLILISPHPPTLFFSLSFPHMQLLVPPPMLLLLPIPTRTHKKDPIPTHTHAHHPILSPLFFPSFFLPTPLIYIQSIPLFFLLSLSLLFLFFPTHTTHRTLLLHQPRITLVHIPPNIPLIFSFPTPPPPY